MKLKRKVYETRRGKRIDFAIGFFGLFIANATAVSILSFVASALLSLFDYTDFRVVVSTYLYLVLPLALNVIAIVLLALTRTWIALGALAAIGAAFLLTLVGAIVVMAVCFATY